MRSQAAISHLERITLVDLRHDDDCAIWNRRSIWMLAACTSTVAEEIWGQHIAVIGAGCTRGRFEDDPGFSPRVWAVHQHHKIEMRQMTCFGSRSAAWRRAASFDGERAGPVSSILG